MTAPPTRERQLRTWLFWFAVLGAVGIAMLWGRSRLDKAHVALTFLLVVLGGSSAGGRALGVSLAGTAFLAFDWFFLQPYETLIIADPLDWLALFAFLITGVVAAELLERQRREAQNARLHADEIDRLATLGAETLNAPRAEEALDAIASVIRQAMSTDRCAIFLRHDDGSLRLVAGATAVEPTEPHSGLLSYTVDHAEAAAQRSDGTLTLVGDILVQSNPAAGYAELLALGIPLTVRGRVVGALQLSSARPFTLPEDRRRVLSALSYYAALGAERVRLAGAEEEAEALRRADGLKDALLASVSHDLRTPLTAIKAIANEVWRGGDPERARIIEQEADRLNDLVENLLELSQINAGSLAMTVALNTVDEVVGAAVERVEAAHGASDGRIEVHIADEGGILIGEFDFMHTTRALTNLLDNALKYSPPESRIDLRVWLHQDRLLFAIEDLGQGILLGDEERVFEPFYRGRGLSDGIRGTGLGLSIARELALAQCGSLVYEPRPGGGSRFTLSLPAGTAPEA